MLCRIRKPSLVLIKLVPSVSRFLRSRETRWNRSLGQICLFADEQAASWSFKEAQNSFQHFLRLRF